jgi:predicted nuclease of predicted toxin-antitoxin system
MKIKLDENLPERLASRLEELGHDVDSVRSENLTGRADDEIWQTAQSVDRFLITQDLDFSDVRKYTPGTHAGVLLVRLAHPGRDALLARVSLLFATEPVEQWQGCVVVSTDHKVRIRRAS